jgi:predicted nucleotidyltransferase component of viral defense system
MDFEEIRKLVIIAMFSDDRLAEKLVLKGGSALELVHRIVSRGSVDVDLSIADEFEDLEDTKGRLFRALRDRFDAAGYVIFDEEFDIVPPPKPVPDLTPWWGGYSLRFKHIERSRYDLLAHDKQRLHRESDAIDNRQRRTFRVQISKYEFCEGSEEHDFEGHRIFVYSPEMTALEKVRAICQQMEGYPVIPKEKKRPRARDFYDIYAIITQRAVDLALRENHALCRAIFEARRVPCAFRPFRSPVPGDPDHRFRSFRSLIGAERRCMSPGPVHDKPGRILSRRGFLGHGARFLQ